MRTVTFAEALREAMRAEMLRDEMVFILGEDVGIHQGAFGVTGRLWHEFGDERVKDTPISEQGFVGFAIGAAACGMRPVVEVMYADFLTLVMDQIVNQAGKMRYMFGGNVKIPLVVRCACGGGISAAAHHSQSTEAWFVHAPGIKVVVPSTPRDAKGLLISAIRDDNPVVFFEHKVLYSMRGEVPEESYTIPLGQGDIKRTGGDVTIVATGLMVHKALAAAETLAKQGIETEVIDPRTLVPLDKELIVNSVKKTHRALIVHEGILRGGIGAEIAAIIADEAFDYLDAPVKRLACLNVPMPFSPLLERCTIPSVEEIVKQAMSLCVET